MTRNPNLPLLASVAPVRVALLTRDPLARAGLTRTLSERGIDGVDVEIVEIGQAEVALWDAGASDAPAERIPDLRAHKVPVVALIADATHAAPALAAGARGVVMRTQVGGGLASALAAARCGLTVIDTSLAHSLVPSSAARPATDAPRRGRALADLTERELQVVQLLAEGLSNKLIADRLGISDHTAKFHVNGVMAKLASSTRTEAVVEAVRRGLVSL